MSANLSRYGERQLANFSQYLAEQLAGLRARLATDVRQVFEREAQAFQEALKENALKARQTYDEAIGVAEAMLRQRRSKTSVEAFIIKCRDNLLATLGCLRDQLEQFLAHCGG